MSIDSSLLKIKESGVAWLFLILVPPMVLAAMSIQRIMDRQDSQDKGFVAFSTDVNKKVDDQSKLQQDDSREIRRMLGDLTKSVQDLKTAVATQGQQMADRK